METQKIVNLLNGSDNENSKFATKKWYDIDNESKGVYSHENSIKFLTTSLESSLCDYSDACVLVTGNIAVKRRNAADTADIALDIEYSDNYLDTPRSLWGFKRDEIDNNANVSNDDNAPSFKYKAILVIQKTME